MREIKTIDPCRYERTGDQKGLRQVGMLQAQDLFDQLERHLSEVGLLPDEYFSCSAFLNGNSEVPDYRTAICHTNWGGSEGIYIDIGLEYYENRERKLYHLATGKTLEDSGDAFLRMSRIAAECSMMLNGWGAIVRVSDHYYETEKETEEKKPSLAEKLQTAEDRVQQAVSVGNSRGVEPARVDSKSNGAMSINE